MEDEQTADALALAREYIEREGWIRGLMVATDGRACTIGAVLVSQKWVRALHNPCGNPDLIKIAWAIVRAIPDIERTGDIRDTNVVGWVTHWNDYVAKSQQRVLDTLAKAEKIARLGYDPDSPGQGN
jgi:hypothetical protein